MELNIATLDRATRLVGDPVHTLTPDDLHRPTPCSDWDVRALVNHLVVGNIANTARISGTEVPDMSRDFLGDDAVGAFDASVRNMRSTFERPGVLDEIFQHSVFGERPGREFLRLRVMEYLAHGWDLAAALGQPRDREPELYQDVLEFAKPLVANRPPAAREAFAPPQEAPPGSCPADQFAALLGRQIPA